MTENTEDTTLVMEVIVGESELICHFEASVRSSELAQMLRRESRGESTTALPLYSMQSALPRCTLPISRAPTPYCLAVRRTAASFVGETDTTHRAPRSWKRANSADASFPRETRAPSSAEAKQDSARVT